MDYLTTDLEFYVHDCQACITAIQDGHPEVALELLQEALDAYNEELENVTESE